MLNSLSTPVKLEKIAIHDPANMPAETPWGWHLVLNLYECNPEQIRSAEVIKQFIIDLCDLIDMRRFGDPIVVDFGDDPVVSGYSMFQLIETSNIAGHFANQSNSAYMDIFSCKHFDPNVAAEFCANVFQARSSQGYFIHRD